MKKYGTARQATDDKIWYMHLACWITKATDTFSNILYIMLFQGNNGYTNTLECYVCKNIAGLVSFIYTLSGTQLWHKIRAWCIMA